MWDECRAWAHPTRSTHHGDCNRNEHKSSGKPFTSLLGLLEKEVPSHKMATALAKQPRNPLSACPHYGRGSARGVQLQGIMQGDTH